jgi:hypothetical protein
VTDPDELARSGPENTGTQRGEELVHGLDLERKVDGEWVRVIRTAVTKTVNGQSVVSLRQGIVDVGVISVVERLEAEMRRVQATPVVTGAKDTVHQNLGTAIVLGFH